MTFKPEKAFHAFVALPTVTILPDGDNGVCRARWRRRQQASETPTGTRVMTAMELYTLYRNKSWQWTDGAGYMTGRDRSFAAWVDGPNGKSWGEGRWVITDTGRMCLKANWYTKRGCVPGRDLLRAPDRRREHLSEA